MDKGSKPRQSSSRSVVFFFSVVLRYFLWTWILFLNGMYSKKLQNFFFKNNYQMINFKSAMKEGIQKKNVLRIVLTSLGIYDIHYHLGGYIRIKNPTCSSIFYWPQSGKIFLCPLFHVGWLTTVMHLWVSTGKFFMQTSRSPLSR